MKKNLKPIPAGNKGLPKLPKAVRNNMGFLKAGGMVKDKRSKFMGGGIAYKGGGMAMPRVKRAGGGPGLYANIAAKKRRIAAGSGETMRKPGSKGAPTAANFKRAAQTAKS
jgi:hypothetical protein